MEGKTQLCTKTVSLEWPQQLWTEYISTPSKKSWKDGCQGKVSFFRGLYCFYLALTFRFPTFNQYSKHSGISLFPERVVEGSGTFKLSNCTNNFQLHQYRGRICVKKLKGSLRWDISLKSFIFERGFYETLLPSHCLSCFIADPWHWKGKATFLILGVCCTCFFCTVKSTAFRTSRNPFWMPMQNGDSLNNFFCQPACNSL